MLTISYAVYVKIIVRYSLYVLYAHTGHVKSAVIYILNNITKKIVLMVDNHNTFMGIPETRNKMSKFLIKHKKLYVYYTVFSRLMYLVITLTIVQVYVQQKIFFRVT